MKSLKVTGTILFLLGTAEISYAETMMTCRSTRQAYTGATITPGDWGYSMTWGTSSKQKKFSCDRSTKSAPPNSTKWVPILECIEASENFDDFSSLPGTVGVVYQNRNQYLLSMEKRSSVKLPGGNPFYPDTKDKRQVLDVLKCQLNRR